MIQAVNEFGTYMVITPKVAYVHAGKDDGVNKNCVSLLLLENEIPLGHLIQSRLLRLLF